MSKNIISFIQITLAIILAALIILQAKGTGLGSTFASELSFYQTKRGVEKILFYLTIFVSFLFISLSLTVLML